MTAWQAPTLWKYTAREIQRRPGRTLLTLLGIVIGVAANVAIALTVQATRRANQDMFEAVTDRAALEVVAQGLGGFRPERAAGLERLDGVRAAVPVIQTPAGLVGAGGAVPVLVLGVDPARDGAARAYVLKEGRPLSLARGGRPAAEVLLVAGFAEANRVRLGQRVQLLTLSGPSEFRVAGLLEARGAATFNGGAVVFMPLARAQQVFGLPGRINSLQLVLAEDADASRVEEAVRKRLPSGLTVQAPGTRGALGRDLMAPTEQGLVTLSLVSLVAGAFVILNAFLMNLGERRRQLAILRALGATRRQVARLLLREAVLLGLAGTVLGIGAGLAASVALRQVLGQMMAVTLPDLQWSWQPYLQALALGPGMAVAATYLPARRAGRRSPLEDLLSRRGAPAEERPRWPGFIGLALLAGALLLVRAMVDGWLPSSVAIDYVPLAMTLFLIACVLVLPLIQRPLACLTAWVLKGLLGTEGQLASRQLDRQPGRTALTVGVLLIAVLFAIGFGQSFVNNLRDIDRWLERVAEGDFIIRGAWPDVTNNITTVPLPEKLADDLRALGPVERVDKFCYILATANGRPVVILAYTYRPDRTPPLVLTAGESDEVRGGLQRGEVVLGTALGQRLGLGVGDTITLETRRGARQLRVAGTATEYTGGGLALYLEWNTAKRLFDVQGVHTFLVTARKGRTAELAGPLQAFCRRHHFLFQSAAGLREMFDRQMAGFLGFVWALVALVFVVAALGIVNTLTMNVLEQTRELGTLRAVGMKRGQVTRLVLAQALGLLLISLIPGVAGGIGLAYLMNLATYPLMGQLVPFRLDPTLLAGCLLVALVITMLAAWLPARRAGRLRVIEALQYE
jgi:putative ABC transport system permease protein